MTAKLPMQCSGEQGPCYEMNDLGSLFQTEIGGENESVLNVLNVMQREIINQQEKPTRRQWE